MNRRFIMTAIFACALYVSLCLSGCSKNSAGNDDEVDDGIAPAVIADLAVAGFSDSSVTLIWTASGDDSTSGTATSYDLRVLTTAIHWQNFDSAIQVTGVPAPKPAGQTEQFEVRGLKTDSIYYFALKVSDENGNYEGISNCVNVTCFNDFAISIPDIGLLAAIRAQISKPTGDILKSDIMTMLDLQAMDMSIADLTGLEYCTNLTILNIINNSVSDLSPLSHLDKLVQLNAGQNDLSDISPIASLTGLTLLNLNSNQVANLSPLAELVHLDYLDIQGNMIMELTPISGLTELNYLNLSYNRIRDIAPLISNTGLGSNDNISLFQNPLGHESIMTYVPALRARGATVGWTDNTYPPGTIIDLAVDTVSVTSVTLSWTAPGEDYYEGTAYHYELRYAADQSELTAWIGGQVVSGLPAPDTAGTIQSVVVSGLTVDSMYYFALRTQDNSENWSTVSNVAWAQPYSDVIVTFGDAALEAVIRSKIAKPSGDIHKSELRVLDSLIADDQGISDLSGIEHCVNLTYLHLMNNNIGDVGLLAGLVGLRDLNLQSNSISDISPLALLENLNILQLSGNPLSDISSLSSLDHLWFLAIGFVGVNDIQSLSSLSELRYLFIYANSISDISPLSNCTHLSHLYADYNSIADITVLGSLSELDYLSLKSNQIQDISPLVSNSGLSTGDEVILEENPLSSVSIDTHIPALQARGVTVTF